jgi:hypothetical protein
MNAWLNVTFLLLGMLTAAMASVVVVEVAPPFSASPFVASPGYAVSYSPNNGINLNIQNPAVSFPNTGQFNDGKWGLSEAGIGGTSWGPVLGADYAGENAPALGLTVSGFAPGKYSIFAQVFVNTAPIAPTDYGLRLGLSPSGLLDFFSSSGGTLLSTGIMPYEIREFQLGSTTVGSGDLTVYLDDFDGTGRATAVFAGLRFEAVPEPLPEPSTIWVILVTGTVLAVRVSRKRLQLRTSASQ